MKYFNKQKNNPGEYKRYKIGVIEPTLVDIKKVVNSRKNPECRRKYTAGKGVAAPLPIRIILSRIKHTEKEENRYSLNLTFFQTVLLVYFLILFFRFSRDSLFL